MSTQATGRLVDFDGTTALDPNVVKTLTLELTDTSTMFDTSLGTVQPNADGTFTFSPYHDDSGSPDSIPRTLRLTVRSPIGRLIYHTEQSDNPAAMLLLGNIPIPARDASGWGVTLGLSPKTQPELPFYSQGNTIRFLVDDFEAWGYVVSRLTGDNTENIPGASQSVNVLQLEFDVPNTFNAAPDQESPQLVFRFDPAAPLDAAHLRAANHPKDYRPERVLLDLQQRGAKVRVMINQPKPDVLTVIESPFILIVGLVYAISRGFAWMKKAWNMMTSAQTVADVIKYFTAAPGSVTVKGFPINYFSRVHAKMVIVDQVEAIVTASPFVQGYFDTQAHAIDEPKRGTGVEIPIHDVSATVRGPAVAAMHDYFALHWNLVTPGDIPDPITVAPATPIKGSPEVPASLQLVRTITPGVFNAPLAVPPLADGEQGALEAYMRAIENAQDFIYFENQYFTNHAIGDALVAALKQRPALRVIMLINVTPDIPYYPGYQVDLIKDMIKTLTASGARDRIGFFSAWTHEVSPTDATHGRIIANYIHTKVGIVDNKWATLGSANLDGSSLDFAQVFHFFQFGRVHRNHEANYVIYDGTDSQNPATGAVDLLRRRLWGEHLNLDSQAATLAATGSNGAQLLQMWRTFAQNKVAALNSAPATAPAVPTTTSVGRVLEFPDPPTSDPEAYLKGLNIKLDHLDLVDQVRSFSFQKGTWDN